jgi:hypothetical protein
MAKVFATQVEDGVVVLKTWPSAIAFEKTESWCSDEFIYTATSSDFNGDHSFPPAPMFDCDLEPKRECTTEKGSFELVYSDTQRAAHALMCEARRKHFKQPKGKTKK